MVKLIALAALVVALLGGAATGYVLRPPEPEPEEGAEVDLPDAPPDLSAPQIVTMNDIFVVPVLRDGRAWSHVVLTLGVESFAVPRDDIILREPLLRDGLNEALFLHASLGGFEGAFTASAAMNRLRARLNEVVTLRLDDPNARVLIISMARQDG